MTIKQFFQLIEIRTKVASVLPFLCGVMASLWLYGRIEPINSLVFFIALIAIDMTTTGLNNLMDYHRERHGKGYGYRVHNVIVKDTLDLTKVSVVVGTLFLLGVSMGLVLVLRTDLWVLLMGMAAFAIGISYTFGPFPLSRTPFGEILSGGTMGFGILFLTVYIQQPGAEWFNIAFLPGGMVQFEAHWLKILKTGFLSAPLVVGIGNIMFANNICDYEEDLKNGRFTLPISIGLNWSLRLFYWAYGALYIFIIMMVLFGAMPMELLLELATAFLVLAKAQQFVKHPVKQTHFKLAVQNFIILGAGLFLCLTVGWLHSVL